MVDFCNTVLVRRLEFDPPGPLEGEELKEEAAVAVFFLTMARAKRTCETERVLTESEGIAGKLADALATVGSLTSGSEMVELANGGTNQFHN